MRPRNNTRAPSHLVRSRSAAAAVACLCRMREFARVHGESSLVHRGQRQTSVRRSITSAGSPTFTWPGVGFDRPLLSCVRSRSHKVLSAAAAATAAPVATHSLQEDCVCIANLNHASAIWHSESVLDTKQLAEGEKSERSEGRGKNESTGHSAGPAVALVSLVLRMQLVVRRHAPLRAAPNSAPEWCARRRRPPREARDGIERSAFGPWTRPASGAGSRLCRVRAAAAAAAHRCSAGGALAKWSKGKAVAAALRHATHRRPQGCCRCWLAGPRLASDGRSR